MTTSLTLKTALAQVVDAGSNMEKFLSVHAPHWAGYGRSIVELASQLAVRHITIDDLRALQDRAYGPFKGTFGSMHDLSFFGPAEDEYQRYKTRIGQTLDALENAFTVACASTPE